MTELTMNTTEESSLRDLLVTILTEVAQCELSGCDELTICIGDDTYYAFKYIDVWDGEVLYDICGSTISLVQIRLPKDDAHIDFTSTNPTDLDKMYRRGTTITVTEG